MGRIMKLENVIKAILNGVVIDDYEVIVDNKKIDSKKLEKCIVSYFKLDDYYKDFSNIDLDKKLYDNLSKYFDEYLNNNIIHGELNDELKEYFNNCDSFEIHKELSKYMQNRLTNIEVIKYIKDLIDKNDLYIYDSFEKMDKDILNKELDRISKMIEILDSLEYKTNEMGIEFKSIYFEPDSFEYNYISPSLYLDKYDISFYKRVLDKFKKLNL